LRPFDEELTRLIERSERVFAECQHSFAQCHQIIEESNATIDRFRRIVARGHLREGADLSEFERLIEHSQKSVAECRELCAITRRNIEESTLLVQRYQSVDEELLHVIGETQRDRSENGKR
jgi:hypothetical protein